jgi:hypothetical protein
VKQATAGGQHSSPSKTRYEQEPFAKPKNEAQRFPSTLKATIEIFPETKVLPTEESQDIWVAIELRGALHAQRALTEPMIDVIFVVDNG